MCSAGSTKVLSEKECQDIRNETLRRYRPMDVVVKRGEDAAKSYGNWAGPTIHALLDTIVALRAELAKAQALPAGIQEALNSGDGTYRP